MKMAGDFPLSKGARGFGFLDTGELKYLAKCHTELVRSFFVTKGCSCYCFWMSKKVTKKLKGLLRRNSLGYVGCTENSSPKLRSVEPANRQTHIAALVQTSKFAEGPTFACFETAQNSLCRVLRIQIMFSRFALDPQG